MPHNWRLGLYAALVLLGLLVLVFAQQNRSLHQEFQLTKSNATKATTTLALALAEERERTRVLAAELSAEIETLTQHLKTAGNERSRAEALARELTSARQELEAVKERTAQKLAASDHAEQATQVTEVRAAEQDPALAQKPANAEAWKRLSAEIETLRQQLKTVGDERSRAEALARELASARQELAAVKERTAQKPAASDHREQATQVTEMRAAERDQAVAQERANVEAWKSVEHLDKRAALAEVGGSIQLETGAVSVLGAESRRSDQQLVTRSPGSPGPEEPESRQMALEVLNATAGQPGSGEGARIRGVAEVLDTGTLRLAGKTVRLFGVAPVSQIGVKEFARYLGSREVVCWPVSSLKVHRCLAQGHDLSAVVLFNGGGRTTSNAPPQLVAAENHARSARVGVWSHSGAGGGKGYRRAGSRAGPAPP
jgi:endonuclease YncB( thermonuclease family)